MNRKNSSIMKYAVNQKSEMFNQEKPVTQKIILPNTQLLRKDFGDSGT